MKLIHLPRFSYLALSLTGLMAATQLSEAQITWVPLADNLGTPALTPFCPGPTNLQPYLKFAPPVMPQKVPLVAYKAWLRPGTAISGPVVTAANDEGVWGTGPEFSQSGTVSYTPTQILREGDATSTAPGAPTYGSAGTLTINNPQISVRGDTILQANLSSVSGKAALHDNCCLQVMTTAGAGAPYADLRAPVIDSSGENVGEWLFQTPANNGILRYGYAAGILPQCDPFTTTWRSHPTALLSSVAPGGVGSFLATPAPIGSPAIGERGVLLFYAWDSFLPANRRPHLRFCIPGGTQGILNRSRDVVPGTDPIYPLWRLGAYAPKLLCISDPSAASMLVAWQMSSMIKPSPSTVTVVEPSLWVQRGPSGSPMCIVKRGNPAPGTLTTFASFYELQITLNTGNGQWVYFGANLSSGARAIYFVAVPPSGPLGPVTLVATDDPGSPTALSIAAPFIGSPLIFNITTLQPWFNADITGSIMFLANSTALPAGSQQVLCSATGPTPVPVVQSQSGLTIPTLTSGTAIIRRFDLAKPDQGVFSRGQAINGAGDVAARILFKVIGTSGTVFTNGEGIYLGR